MSLRDEARKALYDIIENAIQAEHPTVPIEYENLSFEVPVASPYVSLMTYWPHSMRNSLGTEKKFIKHKGIFQVDVTVPENTGTKDQNEIMDTVERALDEFQLTLGNGAYMKSYTPTIVKMSRVRGFWQGAVLVNFYVYGCFGD